MTGHFIRICECGRVLAQCRCFAADKHVETISPCRCSETFELYGEHEPKCVPPKEARP